MKRIIALLLCVFTLLPLLTACGFDENYTGPTMQVYMSDMPTTFDPAYAYLDESSMQILSLIYEGLFSYDEKGKLVNAIADNYKWITQDSEKQSYVMEITLKTTAWSDGQRVTADQFVYAWRRLLDPGMSSEAACLLYDIKNARDVKSGDCSIFDFGATAVDSSVLRIEFDHEIDVEQFFGNLASPALVPIRDDVVGKSGIVDWASTAAIILSNGPFYLKSYSIGQQMRLERNRYYYRDVEKDKMDKYVTPYRLEINFSTEYVTETNDIGETISSEKFDSMYALNDYLWKNGLMHYYSNIPLEYREAYASSVTTKNLLSTAAVYFNTENSLFSDSRVRRALSMVIDRQQLASTVVRYAAPAEGLVPGGVLETTAKQKTTFREAGGSLLSSTADVDGAKALLKEAGVSGGEFAISFKLTDPVATAVAAYLTEVWGSLGFQVTNRRYYSLDGSYQSQGYRKYDDTKKGYDNLLEDCYTTAYKNRDFDVMLVDVCQMTRTAFSTLAPYATGFCGGGVDLSQQLTSYDATHVTGFKNEAYDKLIEEAFAEKSDSEARAAKLHEAEKLLLEEMPVAPLFTYQTNYMESDSLNKVTFSWFGTAVFTKATEKGYTYVPEEGK